MMDAKYRELLEERNALFLENSKLKMKNELLEKELQLIRTWARPQEDDKLKLKNELLEKELQLIRSWVRQPKEENFGADAIESEVNEFLPSALTGNDD